MYVLIYKRFYFYPYNILPLALFALYTAFYHLQNLVLLLAFCTPLAISLKEMGLTQINGPDLSIPSEPIMMGIMLLYSMNLFKGNVADKKYFSHPASILIFIQLSWMLVTTCTSVDIVVSLKYLTSRLWFIFSCYLIIPHLFKDKKNIFRFVFAYCFGLLIVVGYTMVMHARFNFNFKAADWVMSPFYNDHTAYGAALAMFIPVMISFWFIKSIKPLWKIFSISFFVVFFVAIILSYARAGWLSLAIALTVYTTLLLKIKFRTIIFTLISCGALFFIFQTEILMALGKNSTDAEGDFGQNVESISNISSDASNKERINRWACALRMWAMKPAMGWGPGTYMFKYAPFQRSDQLTIISTNFGTNGNAHSEYLGPLAEQGLPGLLIVLTILFYFFSFGYRLIYSLQHNDDKILCTGIFLGLVTYLIHGFFNNFLDTDKLSLPFWAFLAALVCFDLYSEQKGKINA